MNPTLDKIIENLNQYNSFIAKNEFYPIQKAYTTPHFLVLVVRVPGKTLNLYIGRGKQYLGIYVYEKSPPAFLRIQDRFLDYVRSHLVGCKLSKIEFLQSEDGEFFQFRFKTDNDKNWFYIGYVERELFFAKQEDDLIFCSWNNQIENMNGLTWPKSDFMKIFNFIDISKYIEDEEKKSVGAIEQKKREKFLVRKIENIKKDLLGNDQWKVVEEKIMNNEVDLSSHEIKIASHKFNLIGLKTDWEKKDHIFKKIKKLKRGQSLLNERLKEAQSELDQTEKGQFVKKTTKDPAIQVMWKTIGKNKRVDSNKADDFREIQIGALKGLVGLNSSGNDHIRSLANKEHFWFHIENYPGAHCILKTDNNSMITQSILESVASLLRDYSKLEILDIPVMFTQVKNLKGVKGVKGEVIAKKVKYLRCPYRDWKEIISII